MIIHSIIIPVKDDFQGLEKTLQALSGQNLDTAEIIIANDGSSRRISKVIDQFKKKFTNPLQEIWIESVQGSYNARNKGVEACNGEKIFFIDAGIIPENGWFCLFSEALDESDYIGGTVKIIQVENENLGQKFHRHTAFPMADYMKKYHFSGAGFLGVRKEVFEKVGLFKSSLYSGGDHEFGYRVWIAGLKQRFIPEAVAWHMPKTFKEQYKRHQRVIAGLNDLYKLHPKHFSRFKPSILHPVKDLWSYLNSLLHFRKNSVYKSGNFTFAAYFSAQTIHHFQLIRARIKCFIFSNKKYNS